MVVQDLDDLGRCVPQSSCEHNLHARAKLGGERGVDADNDERVVVGEGDGSMTGLGHILSACDGNCEEVSGANGVRGETGTVLLCMSLAAWPMKRRCMLFSATRNEIRRPASRRTSDMRRRGSRNCDARIRDSSAPAPSPGRTERRTWL